MRNQKIMAAAAAVLLTVSSVNAGVALADTSSLAAQAQALYQVYLEAQQAADDAITYYTDEQTVIDTAAAAQAAYASYVAAQNAADEASWGYSSEITGSTASYSTGTSYDTSDLNAKAQSLYQVYLEAQQAADDAITYYTSEQHVIDTAAAAQAAYASYVAAQNAADEASWGTASTVSYAASSSDTYSYTTTASAGTSTSASDLSSKAQALYQTYLQAQSAADDAITNYIDEQHVIDTAAAAQAAYASYVSAQNAADEASWGAVSTQTVTTAVQTVAADTTAAVTTTAAAAATSEVTETTADDTTQTGETASTVSSSDLELLAALIYCEAGNQPYEGQVAVGAVVMNRIASSSFPNTISDVIYESGQFTPAYSGALASALANGSGSNYIVAAQAALSGEDPTNGCLYFNTSHGSGVKIGAHWFY